MKSNESLHLLRQQSELEFKRQEAKLKEEQQKWVKFRLEARAAAEFNPAIQAALIAKCRYDIFFWFQYFAWTYDPRNVGEEWVPFLLFKYQIELIIWFQQTIKQCSGGNDKKNLFIEKSRDMGVSWLICMFFLYYWLFVPGANFKIGSRKEDEVDNKGDLSTPFEKIRRVLYMQPSFFMPPGFKKKEHDKDMLLVNPHNGSQIVGESANANWARGGRYLICWRDEGQSWPKEVSAAAFKSAGNSTNIRLEVGTADGMDSFFYELGHQLNGNKCDKRSIHWKLHPVKAAGRYLDNDNQITSHWYEIQKNSDTPENIAAELDICYEKSSRGVVFKTYVPELHSTTHLEMWPTGKIVRAWDPGVRCFFVLWVQFDELGRVLCLRELAMEDARIKDVARRVKEISKELEQAYPFYEFKWEDVGDPAGAVRQNSSSEVPEYETLQEEGFHIEYEYFKQIPTSQREPMRIQAIKNCLNDNVAAAGTMKLMVDTTYCPKLHKAFTSGYRWKTDKHGKPLQNEVVDAKHPSEDAIDDLGYAVLSQWGGVTEPSYQSFAVDDSDFQWDPYLRKRSA